MEGGKLGVMGEASALLSLALMPDWSCSGLWFLFFILDPEWGGPSM